MLTHYQKDFLMQALAVKALRFGQFELKSGRESPYFFNAGAFCDGKSLSVMARAYAAVVDGLLKQGSQIDVLFGPAYKGIPLVSCVAMELFANFQRNIDWAFNRKEAKTHGEGGAMVGAALSGKRVLILDDVLTAGTAVRESIALLKAQGAEIVGLVVALDRQEKGADSEYSALQSLKRECAMTCVSVVNLEDLLSFVRIDKRIEAHLPEMEAYYQRYGVRG